MYPGVAARVHETLDELDLEPVLFTPEFRLAKEAQPAKEAEPDVDLLAQPEITPLAQAEKPTKPVNPKKKATKAVAPKAPEPDELDELPADDLDDVLE